jgi:hypothetical protein
VLREPTPADYLQIDMNLSAYSSEITDIRLIHDEGWRIVEAVRLRLQEAPRIMLGAEYGELALYDESNNRSGTLKDIINAYLPKGWQEMPPTRIIHQFERATFVKTGVDIFPSLKINAVEVTVSVNKIEAKWSFDVKELIGFILENIIAGKKRKFDKDGKLLL